MNKKIYYSFVLYYSWPMQVSVHTYKHNSGMKFVRQFMEHKKGIRQPNLDQDCSRQHLSTDVSSEVGFWYANNIPLFIQCLCWYHIKVLEGLNEHISWALRSISNGASLTGGNRQKWKRVFLTCPCHEIYRDEAVGLKSCKNTWKITIFVKMWNLGQYRENLIFCQ